MDAFLLAVSRALARAAEADKREVQRAALERATWAGSAKKSQRTAAESERQSWVPALQELADGLDSPSDEAAISQLASFQRRAGGQPAFDTVEGFVSLCSADGPLVLGKRANAPRRRGPADAVLASLGRECASPLPADRATLLRALVADPRTRWVPSHAGVHLAIPRIGGAYAHHGIYLGDGSVVHFTGEPGRKSKSGALVARTSLEKFLADDSLESAGSLRLGRLGGGRVATLDPALILMRAQQRCDKGGYGLLRNNCEHLASWAQTGAQLSLQVRRAARVTNLGLSEAAAAALGAQLVWKRDSAPKDLLLDAERDPEPVDLARAYWSPDRDKLLVDFPLWASEGDPVVGTRRPWAIAPITRKSNWHQSPPALEIDPGWHASLVWIGGKQGAYWLTSDGRWLEPPPDEDPVSLAEARLNVAAKLLRRLVP